MARGRIIEKYRPKAKGRKRKRRSGSLTCARCGIERKHLVRRNGRYYCRADSACGRPEAWHDRSGQALDGTASRHFHACGAAQ